MGMVDGCCVRQLRRRVRTVRLVHELAGQQVQSWYVRGGGKRRRQEEAAEAQELLGDWLRWAGPAGELAGAMQVHALHHGR